MNMINKECNGSDIADDTLNSLFIKCKKRLIKTAVHSMQKEQIEKYLLRIFSKDVAPLNSTLLSKFSSFYDVLTKYFY